MPYIRSELRYDLVERERRPANPGELNFLISSIVNDYLKDYSGGGHGLCYDSINDVVGVLECAKLEAYARLARPYEETKIRENGDVYDV